MAAAQLWSGGINDIYWNRKVCLFWSLSMSYPWMAMWRMPVIQLSTSVCGCIIYHASVHSTHFLGCLHYFAWINYWIVLNYCLMGFLTCMMGLQNLQIKKKNKWQNTLQKIKSLVNTNFYYVNSLHSSIFCSFESLK